MVSVMTNRQQSPDDPGTESVWDYPRPPALVPTDERVEVMIGGHTIASTTRALRVLETSHPPTYYCPPDDVADGVLVPVAGASFCEFKGWASYFDAVVSGHRVARAAWTYPNPSPQYAALAGFVAFYPERVDRCFVDGEIVQSQDGDFYGGWITSRVRGPFKGAPGTRQW